MMETLCRRNAERLNVIFDSVGRPGPEANRGVNWSGTTTVCSIHSRLQTRRTLTGAVER
jgi:hypothetical protein